MTRNHALSLALFSFLAAPVAFTQQAPPAPTGAPAPSGSRAPRGNDRDEGRDHQRGPEGGGMGIVPPGTWWRNPSTINALTLTADQQKRLDDIFLQSRISLIHLHASLEEEQLKLEPLLNANPPDQSRSLAEISKIADLRADLEKADAKMLLSLRGVLTADQWTKLQAEQHGHHDDHGQKRGPQGPEGPQGQRGGHTNGPGTPPPGGSDDL